MSLLFFFCLFVCFHLFRNKGTSSQLSALGWHRLEPSSSTKLSSCSKSKPLLKQLHTWEPKAALVVAELRLV